MPHRRTTNRASLARSRRPVFPSPCCHGKFGPYVRKGEAGSGSATVSVPASMPPSTMTLETALALLALPRQVGEHPESGSVITAGIGRYGPYLKHGSRYINLQDDDVLTIGLNRAVSLIAESGNTRRGAAGSPGAWRTSGRSEVCRGDEGALWPLCPARPDQCLASCRNRPRRGHSRDGARSSRTQEGGAEESAKAATKGQEIRSRHLRMGRRSGDHDRRDIVVEVIDLDEEGHPAGAPRQVEGTRSAATRRARHGRRREVPRGRSGRPCPGLGPAQHERWTTPWQAAPYPFPASGQNSRHLPAHRAQPFHHQHQPSRRPHLARLRHATSTP